MVLFGRIVQDVESTWENLLNNKMGLRKYIRKYKDYETKELARRAAKKKRISPYKSLANKKIPVTKANKKFTGIGLTKAIGNPYGVKYPKAKKVLKKIRKKRKLKNPKVIVVYR